MFPFMWCKEALIFEEDASMQNWNSNSSLSSQCGEWKLKVLTLEKIFKNIFLRLPQVPISAIISDIESLTARES